MKNAHFSSLADVKAELLRMADKEDIRTKQWSIYEMLTHCSQTIEYSMSGYPQMKPKIVRKTIGRLIINKFLRQGFMKHNLTAHVPGAPKIEKKGTAKEGIVTLIKSIDKFTAYTGSLAPHLVFGDLSKGQYDKYFTMHIADHFSELQYAG